MFHVLRKYIFIVIVITKTYTFGLSQEQKLLSDTIGNEIFSTDIHTVLLHSASWEFSLPVIDLGSDQKLELRFDDLSQSSRTFGYTIVHCSADWIRSDLSPQDYLTGFGNDIIRETTTSFNTTYSYTHHRLEFPTEECIPVISGNYALIIYEENNPDDIIITRQFYVTEKTAEIDARVSTPHFGEFNETGQQILFSVKHNNADIRDPQNDVKAIMIQNGRYDQSITLSKAYMVQPGLLEYNDPDKGIFRAGNEFRMLDIKSMRYQTENVAEIDFQNPYYHVILKPEESRAYKPYFSKTDLNGSYYIDREKASDRHTDADYVFVHFNLKVPPIHTADDFYVTGELCLWKKETGNKMKYNEEKDLFELTLLLKQGLYDYCYMKSDPKTGITNEYEMEGSFYETENDYAIFIYFHDRFKRYDRLIGWLSIK